jgi:hypothetical protein
LKIWAPLPAPGGMVEKKRRKARKFKNNSEREINKARDVSVSK